MLIKINLKNNINANYINTDHISRVEIRDIKYCKFGGRDVKIEFSNGKYMAIEEKDMLETAEEFCEALRVIHNLSRSNIN